MGYCDDIECWLIDMDGVFVYENIVIFGVFEMFVGWECDGIFYFVFINNLIFIVCDFFVWFCISGLVVLEDCIWILVFVIVDFFV